MRVNRFLLPTLVLIALLGTIGSAQLAGMWSTSGRTAVNLEQMTPADIKGWMTLQQVIDGFGISQSELYALANIPADIPTSTALKDLEEVIDVTTLRNLLTAKFGTPTPADLSVTSTPLSVTLVVTLEATATHVVGTGTGPTPLPAGQILPAEQIKGQMTLRSVSDQCAVSFDALLVALKLRADTSGDTKIKDLISAGTLSEVTEVQKAVAELQK